MSGWYARVLYAKHVSRKRKTWQDGFLSMNKQGDTRRSVKLYDESGLLVAKGHVPASEKLTTPSEGLCNRPPGYISASFCCLASNTFSCQQAYLLLRAGPSMWTQSAYFKMCLAIQTLLRARKCQSSLLSTAHMCKSQLWHSSHASGSRNSRSLEQPWHCHIKLQWCHATHQATLPSTRLCSLASHQLASSKLQQSSLPRQAQCQSDQVCVTSSMHNLT